MRKSKEEKKQERLKFYRLHWEYLRRSELYKELCLWVRKTKKDPTLKLPEKFVLKRDNQTGKIMQRHPVIRTYFEHGDIHAHSFEDWFDFKNNNRLRNQKNADEKGIEIYQKEVKQTIKQMIKTYKKDCEEQKIEPTLDEFHDFAEYYLNDWENNWSPTYVIKSMLFSDHNDMAEALKEKCKKTRKTPVFLDALEEHLKVYDQKISGLKNKQIARDEDDLESDPPRRHRRKAERIIENVEKGIFPGQYGD